MRQRRYSGKMRIGVLVCAAAAGCLLSACGKNQETGVSGVISAAKTDKQEQQTLSDIRVRIREITAYAGEEIDYMAAIESAENMELNRSMVYVDSSMVDNHTPGVYKAEYTFDYLGETVTSSVKVTILEKETSASKSESTAAQDMVTEQTTAAQTTAAAETAAEQETVTGQTIIEQEMTVEETSAASISTEPITAVVEHELPDAVITLSTGKTVTIKMSSERYITETFTEDTYCEEGGFTFLISELKVLFNTGEIQVVETVMTRVQPPEAETAASEAAE